MSKPIFFLSLVLLLIALSASCSPALLGGPTPTPDPCSPGEIEQYLDAIRDVSRRFDDALTLANSTPRMSLPPAIADLQTIRREAEDLEVPVCAVSAKNALVTYMNATIDGFIAFLSDEPDTKVNAAFKKANELSKDYLEAMLKLGESQ